MNQISPAEFMNHALLCTNDVLTIKQHNKAYSVTHKSPIGNIIVKFSGSPLMAKELNVLKQIIGMTELSERDCNLYKTCASKLRRPEREYCDSKLGSQGLLSQFTLSDLLQNHSDPKDGIITAELLAASIDKFMMMLIEIRINGRLRTFRPINDYIFIDNKYSIHVQELFVFWTFEQTTWREVDEYFGGGNRLALSIK